MAESGHARNVERFTQLVSFVTSYGADYAPSNTTITIPNLQAKLTASLAGIDGVSTAHAGLKLAVNERENAFADLRRLTTRVVNSFAASGAPQNAVDDAKTLKRKIDGVRAKALPQDNPNTPEDESDIVAQQCLKSRIEPENVAALALFLASDDGRMCTGHEYWIDAGWR